MSMNPNPNEQVPWRVVSQTEQVGRTDAGAFVPGILVQFTFGQNNSGQVFVPRTNYSAESVAAAVSDRVRTMHTVGQLSGLA